MKNLVAALKEKGYKKLASKVALVISEDFGDYRDDPFYNWERHVEKYDEPDKPERPPLLGPGPSTLDKYLNRMVIKNAKRGGEIELNFFDPGMKGASRVSKLKVRADDDKILDILRMLADVKTQKKSSVNVELADRKTMWQNKILVNRLAKFAKALKKKLYEVPAAKTYVIK